MKDDDFGTVPRTISFYDLKHTPGAIGIMQRNDKKEVDALLWQFGFNTKVGIDLVECHHRALTTNQPIFGVRIEGVERHDKEWLSSGLASTEAQIEAVKDKTMRDELIKMNKTGSSDKTWCNEETAKAVVRSEKRNNITNGEK